MITSIILLTYNKLEYTKLCIESIRKYTQKGFYEIIVVDNNSSDDTVQWLKEQEDLKTIFNEENLGFPKGCNQGIEIAEGDNILLLNNDTIVTNNWLENLLVALNSSEKVGCVGAVTNNCSNFQTVPTNYQSIEDMQLFAQEFNKSNPVQWEERLKLVGFCMLIKKSVVDEIGLLDEQFSPGNFEDDDYSFRIRKAGYKLLLCGDTFIHHFGSTSFKDKPEAYQQLLRKNKEKFEAKWGFNLDYTTHTRRDLISLIDAPKEEKLNILEVGCACGATLLKIKETFKNANLFGIELNEHTAFFASLIADVRAQDIEKGLDYQEEFFDYIILGDILEHLNDPWKTVNNFKKYLKSNGKLLVSIPNVMHFSNMRTLLNGHWTYTDSGILDRTHLRFFTLNELTKMFYQAGYGKMEVGSVTTYESDEDKLFIEKLSELGNPKIKDQFSAYQYLLKVFKNNPNVDSANDLKDSLINIEKSISIDENVNKIIKNLTDNLISEQLVISIVDEAVINKESVLNILATKCFENGAHDYVIPFLEYALKINPDHQDTIFNLGYFLYTIGELDLARHYLEKVNGDNAARELLEMMDNI
ncbi:bifunctional glycosyltransferase family 2 protein/class I SAM-dependent methyltransferase [Niallia taxi]|uniref:glycosyltransferase n=1 Tax=Niallia taxi TaxID=2499688 RepID=UPI003981DC0A